MRIKRTQRLGIGLVAIASLGLTACGGSSSSSTSTPADTGATTGTSTGTSTGAATAPKGKVGIILPDSATSPRWESQDHPVLEKALKDAGVQYDIQNAGGDATKMQTIADQMITQGVTVLAIVNLDSKSGAAIETKAKASGVKTLDYDRLTLGGSAEAYISFDNAKVGGLLGQGLADCLGDKKSNIVYLDGSPDDNNATLFASGAHAVLDKIANYKKVGEQPVPGWKPDVALTVFEQLLTASGGKVNGVLAANDTLGNAAIQTLDKAKITGVAVTGQDASVVGLQNILAGKQCMTVYKPATQEAGALAKAAVALLQGQKVETNGTTKDADGARDVPSVLLDPITIKKDGVKQVISDGAVKKEDVCAGEFADKCTAAGIS